MRWESDLATVLVCFLGGKNSSSLWLELSLINNRLPWCPTGHSWWWSITVFLVNQCEKGHSFLWCTFNILVRYYFIFFATTRKTHAHVQTDGDRSMINMQSHKIPIETYSHICNRIPRFEPWCVESCTYNPTSSPRGGSECYYLYILLVLGVLW